MTDQQVRGVLNRLYRVAEAGEKGYCTAAANVVNPGLKMLFKSYAQQRAQFKSELIDTLHSLGDAHRPGTSVPGMIHRGRVAIFAAMSSDRYSQEKIVLKEVALGDRVAAQAYQRALARDLPPNVRALVERQLEGIRDAGEQIQLLRGQDGQRMVVGLFDSQNASDHAVESLRAAGFPEETITAVQSQDTEAYQGRGATVREVVLSGAFGGALWGGLTGLLVGFGVVQSNSQGPFGVFGAWLLSVIGFMLIGAFIASALALFIGLSLAQNDSYQYHQITATPHFLVEAVVDQNRADEAGQILGQKPRPNGQHASVSV